MAKPLAQWSTGETIAFGKHRGKKWSDIPTEYLVWLRDQKVRGGWGSKLVGERVAKELERRKS